ncbi:hypothetical protein LSM04_008841 [Trypanosoma melophagium]|uniref:uncharacterized protein n=1 Tax=Trypanosoma melophagium TaxID=715481 RepID=UPI00351A7575|nr:hypothetical protein LSM04_008841 [Trypanosoma melophagium]
MGLALCHLFPRDVVLQIALLFLLVSCVLQGVLVGSYDRDRVTGTITLQGRSTSGVDVVHIATYPLIYTDNGTRICGMSANADLVYVDCAHFVEGFHAVCGLFLSSFIVSVVVLLFCAFCVVPLSKTTTLLIATVFALFLFPISLHSAAIGMFFSSCVRYARSIVGRVVFAGADVEFHRRPLANVAVASEVCIGIGFLLTLIRFVLAVLFRKSVKRRDIVRRDIGSLMQRHIVNDDWERQRTVLQSHARSVQLEMVIRADGDNNVPDGNADEKKKKKRKREVNDSNTIATAATGGGTASAAPTGVGGGYGKSSSLQESEAEFTFGPSRAHSVIMNDTLGAPSSSSLGVEPFFN